MPASPPLHFLFILHLFAWCSCFLSGEEAEGSAPRRGPVLPGEGQTILPGGCHAWLSSRRSWGCGEEEAQSSPWPALGVGPSLLPYGQGGQGGHTGKLLLITKQSRTPCRALAAEQMVPVPLWGLLGWLQGSVGLWGELGASQRCWSRPLAEMGSCARAPLPPPRDPGSLGVNRNNP